MPAHKREQTILIDGISLQTGRIVEVISVENHYDLEIVETLGLINPNAEKKEVTLRHADGTEVVVEFINRLRIMEKISFGANVHITARASQPLNQTEFDIEGLPKPGPYFSEDFVTRRSGEVR